MRSLFAALILAHLAASEVPDELQAIIAAVNPPARFANHQPHWSTSEETVTFQHVAGPKPTTFTLVKDGANVVAVIPKREFYDGSIFLLTHDPALALPTVPWPTGRWHIDSSLGVELRTLGLIPRGLDGKDCSFTVDGATLVYERRFRGQAGTRSGENGTDAGPAEMLDLHHRMVFRCDPVHGYAVDADFTTRAGKPIKELYIASSAPSRRYALWPDERLYDTTVLTLRDRPGLTAWYNNMGAIPAAGAACRAAGGGRDGGFAAYLGQEWSWALTVQGAPQKLPICNAHGDVDFNLLLPVVEPDTDGLRTWRIRHRLLALPAEVTAKLRQDMQVLFAGATQLMLRLGRTEDFEDQPLRVDRPETGAKLGGRLVDGDAHSGTKALAVDGQVGTGGAQLSLKPNTTYRITAWMKLTPWTPEQRTAKQADYDQKRAEAEAKKAQTADPAKAAKIVIPEPRDFAQIVPKAWVQAQFYEWTPHNAQRLSDHRSNEVTSAGEWQLVTVEFSTPAWDPFVDLRFCTEGGSALVDDVAFVVVPK